MSLFLAVIGFLFLSNSCFGSTTAQQILPQPIAPHPLQIIGGTKADVVDYPYQGMLYIAYSHYNYQIQCGCVLIDSSWVLTAAHCTIDATAADLSVYLGRMDQFDFESNTMQQKAVLKLYNHPAYNSRTKENDISLIQLDTEITTNYFVAPISLPTAPAESLGFGSSSCVITGWGATEVAGWEATTLMKATVPLVSNSQCSAWLSAKFHSSVQICAGFENGGIDTCQGDSGGPLACRTSSSQPWTLIGLTSYGFGCARPRSPGVYTRVYAYSSWISTKMGRHGRSQEL